MSKKKAWSNFLVFSMLAGLISMTNYAGAQWGTNAPPCPSHCSPASPWWGYVQTRWTRWPGATYPDMVKAPGPANEGIPVPNVDLPRPNKESEIRSAPTEPPKPAESSSESQETPSEPPAGPTPAKPFAPAKASEMPPVKEAPGATAPDEPMMTPPQTPPTPMDTPPSPMETPSAAPAPSNSSSFQPKPRVRVEPRFFATSAISDSSSRHQVKTEATEVAAAKPLRLRIDVDDFSRPLPSEQGSMGSSSQPAARTNGSNVVASSQSPVESGNPLRAQFAAASSDNSAPLPSSDERAGSAYRSDSNSYSSPAVYQR